MPASLNTSQTDLIAPSASSSPHPALAPLMLEARVPHVVLRRVVHCSARSRVPSLRAPRKGTTASSRGLIRSPVRVGHGSGHLPEKFVQHYHQAENGVISRSYSCSRFRFRAAMELRSSNRVQSEGRVIRSIFSSSQLRPNGRLYLWILLSDGCDSSKRNGVAREGIHASMHRKERDQRINCRPIRATATEVD
jgi:hypothetical protein